MSYEKEQGWETHFPYNLIRVRIQANNSYQLSRLIKHIGSEKDLTEVDRSKIMVNHGGGPKLRVFVTFKDAKSEKLKKQKQKKKWYNNNETAEKYNK